MDLIFVPFHDWKKMETYGFRNRDGHLLHHFLSSPRVRSVLFVDRPISPPERLLKWRPVRCRSGTEIARSGRVLLTRVTDKLTVVDFAAPDLILPLYLRRDWWDHVFRRKWVLDGIRWAAQQVSISETARVLFCCSPLATGPFGNLSERVIAFDAIDNWRTHSEMRDVRGWILRGYEAACRQAQVLICNSRKTEKFLRSLGGSPEFLPNGVDPERWDPALLEAEPVPKDLSELPRPWIGYAGLLAKRIDVELIRHVALARPHWSIVLIGPVVVPAWLRPLRALHNVHFLGEKHYDELPRYVAKFDVGAIFHNVGALEVEGDPTKLYEYLAAGLPVVTTPIDGVQKFAGVISISPDATGFLESIDSILLERAQDPRRYWPNRESILNSRHQWKSIADSMLDRFETALSAAPVAS